MQTDEQAPLRLWPGVALVGLQWLGMLVFPAILADDAFYSLGVRLIGGVLVAIWWVFFSRAARLDRWGALILAAAAMAATRPFLHESVATSGMGFMYFISAFPVLALVFVGWAVLSRHLPAGPRRTAMVTSIVLACGGWTLLRLDGIGGSSFSDFSWRWSQTAEERLLAQVRNEPTLLPAAAAPDMEESVVGEPVEAIEPSVAGEPAETEDQAESIPVAPVVADDAPEWPGFRGPERDGNVRGVTIDTDWAAAPPTELWRRAVGPGWSSFAVAGDLIFTQEQRGEEEVVSCYRLDTGEPVWMHRDAARFWEANAGPGPRATPTLRGGRVYTVGATGILNALNAADGSAVWSRDIGADTGVAVPDWGFAASPVVVDDVVIVAAAGTLAGYDWLTGDQRWTGPKNDWGFSSPHLVTFDGVQQVLMMSDPGLVSVAADDGALLWEHPWPTGERILQPALTRDGDLLLSAGNSQGVRLLAVSHGADGWSTTERWTSFRLKPYFSDYVVHDGHAYGFDGRILAAIDLTDGERRWKGGRYGYGQMLLLPEQDLLLVTTVDGELALVRAAPDEFVELARVPGVEGKTWNHPVLIRDVLLVRNGEQMAAFRLASAAANSTSVGTASPWAQN